MQGEEVYEPAIDLVEREEEAEKEPAAQEPSLLMQGEEVHEQAIALMVSGDGTEEDAFKA